MGIGDWGLGPIPNPHEKYIKNIQLILNVYILYKKYIFFILNMNNQTFTQNQKYTIYSNNNLSLNEPNQNIPNISSNQIIYNHNITSQQAKYNHQASAKGNLQRKEQFTNYQEYDHNNQALSKTQYNNSFGGNTNNLNNKIVVHKINEKDVKPKKLAPCLDKDEIYENKIKIIFVVQKNGYEIKNEMEFKKSIKFKEVVSLFEKEHFVYKESKYIFNENVIDLNKTLDELNIYNNSKIIVYEDIQDVIILDHSSLINNKSPENEEQIINIILILNKEDLKEYHVLIHCKKGRKLEEIYNYFKKKIGLKKIDIIDIICLNKYPYLPIFKENKTLDKLGIQNNDEIIILIRENIFIIDETSLNDPYILKNESKIIIIKLNIMFGTYFPPSLRVILIQCRNNRKFRKISSYYRKIIGSKEFNFEFNGNELDEDKTLSELGINNDSKIFVKICDVNYCILPSFDYILKDAKKKEKNYIVIKFIKNNKTIKFIFDLYKKFKKLSLKFINQIGIEKQYNFYFNKKIIDQEKTLEELGIENNSKIFVFDVENSNDISQNIKEKKEIQKYSLNIIYYDENLLNKENSDNCSFLNLNMNGTFYGCHYFELFKIVCEKIKKNKKEFILITSGSCAEKIFNYCSNINEIRDYLIYCYNEGKYKPLMKLYPKLKGIYSKFQILKNELYNIEPIKINNISSSNLIFFEDYNQIYIKLHYEFIQKYGLYKKLKSINYDEDDFIDLVEKEQPHFLELAKQLFPDSNEIINFFKNNIDLSKEKDCTDENLNKIFRNDDIICEDNISTYIHNYTKESFYYKYLNKFLRMGNFDAFRKLSNHLAKFIFKLYEYRNKNISNQSTSNLYRKMYLDPKDIKLYKDSIGKVICYPAFTSTSLIRGKFIPKKYNNDHELVLLEIEQNNSKSVVSISKDSAHKKEEEYLFLPFSLFKIKNVELREGNKDNPHIIYLKAINSDKPIEEMFFDFMNNETDNLNPEGLDLLILDDDSDKIVFNQIYLYKTNNVCNCSII